MSVIEIGVRRHTQPDIPFILDTWLHSVAKFSLWSRNLESEVFFRNHRRLIDKLVNTYTTLVAYDPERPNDILGFCCGNVFDGYLILNYVLVRRDFKRHGIAKAMLKLLGYKPKDPIICTHWTSHTNQLARRYPLVYNPYILFDEYAGGYYEKTRPEIPSEGLIIRYESPNKAADERGRIRPNMEASKGKAPPKGGSSVS